MWRCAVSFEITGFDSLQKTLEDASQALKSLDGEIGTLRIDPNNPDAAIAEMERIVDAKVATYKSNPIVAGSVAALKQQVRERILAEAEEARRKAGNT
jgi:hypothetical protein